jgi:hypothetical protein
VVKLASKNTFTKLFSSRQTFSLVFLWVLTWFSYILFMKNQINIINITGAVTSAGLLIFSYLLPSSSVCSITKKIRTQKNQEVYSPQKQSLESNKKIFHSTLATTDISQSINQKKVSPKQVISMDCQKQEQELTLSDKREKTSEENYCPNNLEYFTKRPRPKQMPEECLTCKKLITCVCLTSN